MCRKLLVLLALFLLVALPTAGQRSDSFFSLTTEKTFLPGEKISVRLYSHGLKTLEFRVYRVNDPLQFFEHLGDVHNFNSGGLGWREEVAETPTPLERFHDWKMGIWFEVRNFFRAQYSAPSRSQIRQTVTVHRESPPVNAAVFAQVPLLNESQLVARWRQSTPYRYLWESEAVPVDGLANGAYLMEATDGTLRAYTILIVSDIGLITKSAAGQIVAYVADRRTGAPIPGATVHIRANKQESRVATTDAKGLVETTLPNGRVDGARVIAVHGADVALTTPHTYFGPNSEWTGYVYTDRPVYRPGHVVHLRAVLRTWRDEKYAVPEGQQVQIQIDDPTNKQVFQSKLPVSEFGTIHGDFTLPTDAALGYYGVSLNVGGVRQYSAGGGFHVEEYKKPEYEVQVHIAKPRILQGDTVDATIQAQYYFGEPVAGAAVKYVVHTSPYWSPFIERDDEDEAEAYAGAYGRGEAYGDEGYYSGYSGEQVSEQSGTLDANGTLVVHIPTRMDDHHRDVRYRIEARVTDEGNREISGAASVPATYGSFALGVSVDSYVYQEGQTLHATAVARDYDGHPVSTPVRLELVRPEFYRYTPERFAVVSSEDVQTDADGRAQATFALTEAGSLELRVTAIASEARQVTQMTWLWVTGEGETFWSGNQRSIRIIADKKSYQAGDTAHVLILTGVPESYLLVASEGRTIRHEQIVHATSPAVTVEISLGPNEQPNVWISAAFLRDNQFYQAQRSLKVPAVQQQLQIDVRSSKPQFQPGEKATFAVFVRDAAGKPVKGEFSLGIVDEAIYAIQPETASDIFNSFYGTVYDRVGTETSLNFYFNGTAGKRAMLLADQRAGRDSLAQLKPSEPPAEPRIRKDFSDTALWVAELRTDSNGCAETELTFPDSLTSWRATVRGVTSDSKVGSAIDRVVVRKNLMVRLVVPRFFRQGDEVTISAIVHNYLEAAKNVTVSLDIKGLDIVDGATRQVQVDTKAETKVDWRVRAQNVQAAEILAKALATEESDAMEISLPVIAFGVKLHDAKSGALSDKDSDQTTAVSLPADFAQATPDLDISVSSSVAGSLFGALDYLTTYPYGCTEQTMSGFLPDIVVAKAMKDLHLQKTVDTPELEKKIHAGMERLKDFQHEDGGWGWWKEDESLAFMTAYVVSGYGQSQAAGYDVDHQSLLHGQQFLRSSLDHHPDTKPDLRAYVVYALELTGAGNSQMLDTAWQSRDSMAVQGLTLLGLALDEAGEVSRAQEIARKLEAVAAVSGDEAHWDASRDYLMEFEFDNSADATAYAMQLLTRVSPSSPLLPKAAFWLVNHRDGGYFWQSTQQTAMAIFGLTEYVAAAHELEANFHAEVYVNGKQVISHQFNSGDAFNPSQPRIRLDAAHLRPGQNDIRIRKTGAGRLYWSLSGEYYSSEKRQIDSNKLSLGVTRDYFRLTPQQADNKVTYHLDPLSGPLHVGDVLAVRVTVGGNDWRYLLVEDPVPAGAEFIQRDDLYELDQRPLWWERWFVRREFHDDHAAFFQTYFTGTHEYVYLLKIVNPGKFRVSPAMVQPMYQPSLQATSDAANIEVTP
jgi:alpha-2-macroglobulin